LRLVDNNNTYHEHNGLKELNHLCENDRNKYFPEIAERRSGKKSCPTSSILMKNQNGSVKRIEIEVIHIILGLLSLLRLAFNHAAKGQILYGLQEDATHIIYIFIRSMSYK